MKTFKNISSNVSVSMKVTKWVNGVLGVKTGSGLVNLFIKQIHVIGRLTPSRVRICVITTRILYKLYKAQGKPGLVKFLKASQVCLMQSIGSNPLLDMTPLGCRISRTIKGLPRVIPVLDRKKIHQHDVFVIRFWMSVFSLYRLVEIPSIVKLRTITDPPKPFNLKQFTVTIEGFSRGFGIDLVLNEPYLFPIFSTSSTQLFNNKVKQSTSFDGIIRGLIAVIGDLTLFEAFKVWVPLPFFNRMLTGFTAFVSDHRFSKGPFLPGALAFLKEPAGKMRVIAMVDCWTQWALKPLHDSIFKELTKLETDGTFDQVKPIKRLMDKGHTSFWCYDLSAATDRLPISLQVLILTHYIGDIKAKAWADLLVGREYSYILPNLDRTVENLESCRYAAGQPMGAYSSWAMLALTHHVLVAHAAKRVGIPIGLFKDYAILGDDIVIANGAVARSYLLLMREIGVEIGIAKSLVSRNGVLEFAKRFFVGGKDCSAVSLKEVLTAVFDIQTKLELGRKYKLSLPSLMSISGWGFRAKAALTRHPSAQSKQVANLGLLYFSPWGVVTLEFVDWLGLQSFVLNMNKGLVLRTPKLILKRWQNRLIEKVMNLKFKTHSKYKFPLLSFFDWMEVIRKPIIQNYSGNSENFLVKNFIINTFKGIWEKHFNGILKDVADLRPALFSHGVSFETLMKADRIASLLRSPENGIFLIRPKLRGKETLRVPAMWFKEESDIRDEYLKLLKEHENKSKISPTQTV